MDLVGRYWPSGAAGSGAQAIVTELLVDSLADPGHVVLAELQRVFQGQTPAVLPDRQRNKDSTLNVFHFFYDSFFVVGEGD